MNGSPAVLAVGEDRVIGVISLEVTSDGVAGVYIQANPGKLERVTRQWTASERGEPLVKKW